MRPRSFALPLALLLLAAVGRPDLSAEDWQRVQREAADLAGRSGEISRKLTLVEDIGREDSERAVRLLLEVAAAAVDRREKTAAKLAKAEDDLAKATRKLRQKHGRKTSPDVLEKDTGWRTRRDAVAELGTDLEAEDRTLRAIGDVFGGIRTSAAVAVLVDRSDKTIDRAWSAQEVRTGVFRALQKQESDAVAEHLLAFAGEREAPETRAQVLDWIAEHKVAKGFDVAIAALRARESAVARSAVAALAALDDRRCVPKLIEARQSADGLLAEEIELLLHHFTGKSFMGTGAEEMWKGWWKTEGEAWLKSAPSRTHQTEKPERRGKNAFYGIETRSDRIVFVLDRSGSMKDPVPQERQITGKRADERVPGDTKMEVAKNQLIRTIRGLSSDVKFAVVFYSHEVHTWQDPPVLMPANAANKKKAVDWVENVDAVGSTLIFEALDVALRYAKVGGGKSDSDPRGADTIFLLSDGAPSTPDGTRSLSGKEIEDAVTRFLDANRPFRCVVHTIGVGPEHNKSLMQRLASDTGGTYRAVGTR